DVLLILTDTDKDFIPALTAKYRLIEIVEKYISFAHIYIAYVEGEPAGLVTFYPNLAPKDSYLSVVAVRSSFRGMNIGKMLEENCILFCKNINSEGLCLNMRKSNERLFKSRVKMGYIVIKEYQLPYSDETIVDMR